MLQCRQAIGERMEVVTPLEDLVLLRDLVISPAGLTVVGQFLVVVSLLVLMADVVRLHADIYRGPNDDMRALQKRLERELSRNLQAKRDEIRKFKQLPRTFRSAPVTKEDLYREVEQLLHWHDHEATLTHATYMAGFQHAVRNAWKSRKAVQAATWIAVLGICLQVGSLFV